MSLIAGLNKTLRWQRFPVLRPGRLHRNLLRQCSGIVHCINSLAYKCELVIIYHCLYMVINGLQDLVQVPRFFLAHNGKVPKELESFLCGDISHNLRPVITSGPDALPAIFVVVPVVAYV